MISNTAVIYPPSRTQCRLVCGRVEESQSQVTPDTPWPSGLAFPRPPVFEGHQILQSDAHWRRLKGDLSCLGCVCTERWGNKSREGVDWHGLHWGVRHKTLPHTKLHGIAFNFCSKFVQIFDYVKADFCSDFHDFLVTDVILVILANGIWDSPVLKPSFKRQGACHVSQSLILLRIILVISAISADGVWDELSLVPDPLVHIHHQWIWVQDACLLAALKSQQMFLQFRQIAIWYNAETWVMWYMQTNS